VLLSLGCLVRTPTTEIDLIHRQFDPKTNRFFNIDPVTNGQESLSTYQYGWNNPMLRPDPNGDCPGCKKWVEKKIDELKKWWNEKPKQGSITEGLAYANEHSGPGVATKTNGETISLYYSYAFYQGAEYSVQMTAGVQKGNLASNEKTNQVNLQNRANTIQNSQLNSKARNLSTTSVAEITNKDGSSQIVVSSSRQRLTPTQRNAMQEGEIEVKGKGHAEATIVNYAEANGSSVLRIAASRPVCEGCQAVIVSTNAIIQSPLKPVKIPFKTE
jgi:RHS repeat-associated protein